MIGKKDIDRKLVRAKQDMLDVAFKVIEQMHTEREGSDRAALEQVMQRAVVILDELGYPTKQTKSSWGKLLTEEDLIAAAFTPGGGFAFPRDLPTSEHLNLRDPVLREKFENCFRGRLARLHETASSRNGRMKIDDPFAIPLIRVLAPFFSYCKRGWVKFESDASQRKCLTRLGDAYTSLVIEALEQAHGTRGIYMHGFRVGPPLADLILRALQAVSIEEFKPGEHVIRFDNLAYFGEPYSESFLSLPASVRRAAEDRDNFATYSEEAEFEPRGLEMPGGASWRDIPSKRATR